MHSNYEDIRSRIAETPTWYDANGTPRYGPFTPEMCPNIYAHTVVLLRIACAGAGCRQRFDVEMHDDFFSPIRNPKNLHYGDPPRHPCEYGGDTMNCDDIAVLEVWHRKGVGDWVRIMDLEGLIDGGEE
jgi:hypothetical protein